MFAAVDARGMPAPPNYRLYPGDTIQIVVVQKDGGRALVVGKLDRVPDITAGRACKLEVHATDVRVLAAVPSPQGELKRAPPRQAR